MMIQIIVRVPDLQKAALLFELLSALNFVESVTFSDESSGIEQHYARPHDSPQYAQRLKEDDAIKDIQPTQ